MCGRGGYGVWGECVGVECVGLRLEKLMIVLFVLFLFLVVVVCVVVFFPKGLKKEQEFYHYANRYPTAEINTSFYGIPRESTIQKWADQAKGRDFEYAIKIPKSVTHESRLEDPGETLTFLWTRLEPLRKAKALGPLLFQLPPSFVCSVAKLQTLARVLAMVVEEEERGSLKVAFEFRHPSWNCDEVYGVLREQGWGLVLSSHPEYAWEEVLTSAAFVYVRFHGIRLLHADNYSNEELEGFADKFKVWLEEGRDVYAYFQFDEGATGLTNGAELVKMVTGSAPKPAVPVAGTLFSFFSKPSPAAQPTSRKRSLSAGDGGGGGEGEGEGEERKRGKLLDGAASTTGSSSTGSTSTAGGSVGPSTVDVDVIDLDP